MPETLEQPVPVVRLALLNRKAVKAYALQVSREKRGGKFTRVSEDFINDVEATVDSFIRNISVGYGVSIEEYVTPDHDHRGFVTNRAHAKIGTMLELTACKIIQLKVRRHPSIGVTLK